MHAATFTIFGEVLFDHFPDGIRVLGGAPFNVAWHLQALGRQPLFISRVGKDTAGDDILATMQGAGMTRSGVQIDTTYPTGNVTVSITDGQPDYRILDQQAYDFIGSKPLPQNPKPGLLYHGSLALRNPVSRQAWLDLRQTWHDRIFLDVNLRAPWWRADEVLSWIADADWLKLNDEELALLLPGKQDIAQKMLLLQQRFQLSGVVVTRGSQGALALNAAAEFFDIVPERNLEIVDTVGAGDAFAAVLLLGIAEDWPMALTLKRAQDFASALVGQRGATIADPAFYRRFIDAWL